MNKISLLKINTLKPHEATIPEKVMTLLWVVLKSGKWPHPIVVDEETSTIMDGHHRHKVALLLGLKVIPCYLVNYQKDVVVSSRRNNYSITAETIIHYSSNQRVYPYKTTRHTLSDGHKLPKINFLIKELQ